MHRPELKSAPIKTPYGYWLIIPDLPSTWTPAYSLKEPDVQYHLSRCLKRADTFIDCGANLGWYALQASCQAQIKKVVAIEPVKHSVHYIGLIRTINDINKLQVIEGCVTDRNGPVSFTFQDGAYSELGFVTAPDAHQIGETVITGYTLETILSSLTSRRICIKIDVEGHERNVLASARPETLHQRVEAALIEVHLYKFADPCEELRQICDLVVPIGPPAFLLNAPTLYPGWQRLLRHAFNYYPARSLTLDKICELIRHYELADLFVLAERTDSETVL